MSEYESVARHNLELVTEVWADKLDQIIGRLTRPDSHLVLELESPRYWIVRDLANLSCGEPAVMMRADHDLCVRFMRAFAQRHPEATVDLPDVEFSWRVAQAFGTLSEREVAYGPMEPHESPSDSVIGDRKTRALTASRSESVLATVHPFPKMHEPLDESA